MTKTLERDLGLPAVVAISIGAMIGSGIFILPAIAYGVAGPAVVLVYVTAGLLVLPAALSQSELATAMPKAGGAYLYIERGLGPLFGTVAGLGTWFSLTFKSALALVGGVPYLLLLLEVPGEYVTPLALTLATILVGINLVGAKQTGLTQVAVVTVMLAALAWFVAGGGGAVDRGNFSPFLDGGFGNIVAAVGLVFVSYAGVTKVASVAEEIERPDRNIPLGIIGSLLVTTVLYALIVAVMVGVVPGDVLATSPTPMADAADRTLGSAGVVAVVVAAVLALVSTANAGVLSASRYPFAMARDRLVPATLGAISDRLGTPSTAITLTGVVTLVLVAFVPIAEIAKLASAFQFVVFALVNVAVIVFRESDADYDPAFRSPLYPWIQILGVASSLVLVTQMGLVPLAGAGVIVAGGVAWYLLYARSRVDRVGVAVSTARRRIGDSHLTDTRSLVADGGRHRILVVITEGTPLPLERTLVDVAATVARAHDGVISVVRFETVPDQQPLDYAAESWSGADVRFEEETKSLADDLGDDVEVEVSEVVSHDTAHAIVNYARHHQTDLVVVAARPPNLTHRWPVNRVGWIRRHLPCDLLIVDGAATRPLGTFDGVRAIGDGGPYHPLTVLVSDALGTQSDRGVVTFEPDNPTTSDGHRNQYVQRLTDMMDARTLRDRFDETITDSRRFVVVLDRRSADTTPSESLTISVWPCHRTRGGVVERAVRRLVY
jgi:amino acid transporter